LADTSGRLRFGPFVLDLRTRQLHRGGAEIHLSRKAFELLATLIAERPRVMSKQELQTMIWPDSHVDAAGLNVLVGDVRKLLGDDAKQPAFIRTVHGVGFAFCAEVAEEAADRADRAAGAAWLVAGNRTFTLGDGENVIGRDPRSAVWLDESGVSRRHAAIVIDAAQATATLRDLARTNGTYIGQRRVDRDVELADGDTFDVGSVTVTFRRWSSAQSADTKRIKRKSR
jgi:DNA-binding winged helix-turn-helix (wHTH) protein